MILSGATDAAKVGTGQSSQSADKLEEDLNQFLTLLVTQLQNQDPLEPLDANEFTAQLVQFASVEQQIYQNANLESLLEVQQNQQVGAMVNFLGTTIEAVGDLIQLENGNAVFTYAFNENVQETTIVIKDAKGRVVFTRQGEETAGRHKVEWDGRDSDGVALPDGPYLVEVFATRPDGTFADVAQTSFGRVTGAAVEGGDVLLFTGDLTVPMDSVLSVKEAKDATKDETVDTEE